MLKEIENQKVNSRYQDSNKFKLYEENENMDKQNRRLKKKTKLNFVCKSCSSILNHKKPKYYSKSFINAKHQFAESFHRLPMSYVLYSSSNFKY